MSKRLFAVLLCFAGLCGLASFLLWQVQPEHYRIVSNDLIIEVRHLDGRVERRTVKNLRTNGGADFYNAQLLGTSAAGTQANYLALTSNSTAPAATDTTLTGEIDDTYGLGRAQASVSHTASVTSSVLSKTWTYTGSSSVQINKIGVFTASSNGTMVYEAAFASPPSVSQNGDQVTVQYTINY